MGNIKYISKDLISKNKKNYDLIIFNNYFLGKGNIRIINDRKYNVDYLFVDFCLITEKTFNKMINIIKDNEYKNILIPGTIVKYNINKKLFKFVKSNNVNFDILTI